MFVNPNSHHHADVTAALLQKLFYPSTFLLLGQHQNPIYNISSTTAAASAALSSTAIPPAGSYASCSPASVARRYMDVNIAKKELFHSYKSSHIKILKNFVKKRRQALEQTLKIVIIIAFSIKVFFVEYRSD